jgi:putative heme-binding domain-containing protein
VDLKPDEREEVSGHLAKLVRGSAIQDLAGELLASPSTAQTAKVTVLRGLARCGLKELPDSWLTGIAELLNASDGELLRETIITIRSLAIAKPRAEKLTSALVRLGSDTRLSPTIRLSALAAVPGGLAEVTSPQIDFLKTELGSDVAGVKSMATDVLARAKLTNDQLRSLTETVKSAGPLELDRLLEAFSQCRDDDVGQSLVSALMKSPLRSALRRETIQPRLAKFSKEVHQKAEQLYKAIDADNAKQLEKLDTLLTAMKEGDVRRGQIVFNSSKAACISCHAMGYLGGKIGPDLTRIGKIRSERDLLEAIVFPSASFVRNYEPIRVTTKNGKTYNGLIKKDTPDELVLTIAADQDVRIPRPEIDEVQPGTVSVMPNGLDQQLTVPELADLIAFLKACQ